jgi:uncharacterized protein with PQ loop repeat
MCDPGAIAWVEKIFGDCIITDRDKVSFGVGLISNVIFLVSALPQIIRNFHKKKVDGQSIFFFGLLLTADTLNLIGLIITHGLITQLISGIFYVLSDACLCTQFVTYKYILKTNDAPDSETEQDSEDPATAELSMLSHPDVPTTPFMIVSMASHVSSATDIKAPYSGFQLLGTLFGWGGGCIFIASRLPQIAKNWKAHQVQGISVIYVILTFLGNLTYVGSILIRSLDGTYVWKQTPFLAGAIGPMFCDAGVLFQYYTYPRREQGRVSESEEGDVENGKSIPEL